MTEPENRTRRKTKGKIICFSKEHKSGQQFDINNRGNEMNIEVLTYIAVSSFTVSNYPLECHSDIPSCPHQKAVVKATVKNSYSFHPTKMVQFSHILRKLVRVINFGLISLLCPSLMLNEFDLSSWNCTSLSMKL